MYTCKPYKNLKKKLETINTTKYHIVQNFGGEKYWWIYLQLPKNLPSKCIITLCHIASSVMFNCQNFTIQMHLQASSIKNSILYSSLNQFVTKITWLLCKTFLWVIDCQEPLEPFNYYLSIHGCLIGLRHSIIMNCCFTYLECLFIGDWYVCN